MFEYVKDLNLKPARPYAKRVNTKYIILHHFESDATVESIHAYHIRKGNRGIDYNIIVRLDGSVVWGRGLEFEGGHVSNTYYKTKGINATSVGIACQGNFNVAQMSEVQYAALLRVVKDVAAFYKIDIKNILQHKQIAGTGYTDCAGKHYPYDRLIKDMVTPQSTVTPPQEPKKLYMKVKVNTLNVRETEGGKVIGSLKKGVKVEVVRYVPKEKWARIIYKGKDAFVWLAYIS